MKDWVRERLDTLDKLFPPERIERSKERLTRVWHGDAPPDRQPFAYYPISFGYYDDVHTPEQRLRRSLDEFVVRGRMRDDFIPALFPGCRQSTIPNMFGAPEVVKGTDYTCERVIADLEAIDRLPEPEMGPGTVAGGWLEMQQYFLDETEGRLPVHVTDMQGPLDVAAQMWSYDELLTAPYVDPERYDRLLRLTTKAFIEFWAAQRDLMGDLFVGTHLFGWNWLPPGEAVTLSADSLVMLSPDFYKEALQPYLERIVEALGPVAVHSCGDFSAVIPDLCATPGVAAVNAGQMTLDELARAGVTGDVLAIATSDYDAVPQTLDTLRRHKLRADLTVNFPWPNKDGQVLPFSEWTARDWDAIRAEEDRMLVHF